MDSMYSFAPQKPRKPAGKEASRMLMYLFGFRMKYSSVETEGAKRVFNEYRS